MQYLADEILAKRSVRVTGEVTWWQFQQYLHNYQRLRGNANLFQNQLRYRLVINYKVCLLIYTSGFK